MEKCIFCKIISRKIPSEIVYENDDYLVIKDISPKAKIHLLAIPKEHYSSMGQMTEEDGEKLGKILRDIPLHVFDWGLSNGYRLLVNQGSDAHQLVPHMHIHVLGGQDLGE